MDIRCRVSFIFLLIAFLEINQLTSLEVEIETGRTEISPIANAVATIVQQFDLYESNTVDFILGTIELFKPSSSLSQVLDQILDNISATIPIRISDINSIKKVEKRSHNILLVKDYESVQNIINSINSTLFDFEGLFLLAFSETLQQSEEIIQRIFTQFFEMYILNVVILSKDVDTPQIVDLHTYFPFTANHCQETTPVLFNRFIEGEFEKDLPIFPDKVANFYGCHFRAVCWHYPPIMDLTTFRNGRLHPEGIDGNLLRVLAKELNFSYSFLMELNRSDRGIIFGNGTSTGSMKMMIEGNGNFSICGVPFAYDRSRYLSASYHYYFTSLVFALRPEKLYSPLYRLFFPFRLELWCIVTTVFIVAFIGLIVLKFFNGKFRTCIIGERNHSPFLHMFAVTLGETIPTVPSRSFARITLMFWILATAVLRTSYEGVLFTFLQKKEYRHSPSTIKGMIDSGYIPYVPPSIDYYIPSIAPNSKYQLMYDSIYKYYDRLYDPNFNGIILYPQVALQYYNSVNWSRPALRTLPEKVANQPISILFKKNSFLKSPFDAIIWKIRDSGLVEFWASKMLNRTMKSTRFDMNTTPKIESSDLEGCFRFWVVLLLTSVLIFIVEKLSVRIPRLRNLLEFYLD